MKVHIIKADGIIGIYKTVEDAAKEVLLEGVDYRVVHDMAGEPWRVYDFYN